MSTTVHPTRVNFRLYLAATFVEVATLHDAAGAPVDLTGWSARMYIKRDPQDTAPIYDLSTANGGIVVDSNGQITIRISALQTSPVLSPPIDPDGETWVYDLLLTNPATSPPTTDRQFQGAVSALPGITPNPAP